MRKILFGLAGLLVSQLVFAGPPPPGGFSSFNMSWTAVSAVPTLGLYGTIALALLVMVVLLRVLRDRPAVVRVVAPVAAMGLTLGAGLWTQDITAGSLALPTIGASSCSGSATYTADPVVPPPCFVNTCGAPVTVSYTFLSGEDPAGDPLTAEGCTLDYYCEEVDVLDSELVAAQGGVIPSNGEPYATAYCQEIFGLGPPAME